MSDENVIASTPDKGSTSIARYNGVWYGSRARAEALLNEFRVDVLPIHDAVRWLQDALHEYPGALMKVRWVNHTDTVGGVRLTLALCYLQSLPEVRQLVYALRQSMVQATGWYPVTHGEPLSGRSYGIVRAQLSNHAVPSIKPGPTTVEDASGPAGGCAIRLRIGHESVLLDSGFMGKKGVHAISERDRFVWISHAHADHAQGWARALDPPLGLMSDGTAHLLHSRGHIDGRRLRESVKVLGVQSQSSWDDRARYIRMKAFPVPHHPGAAGLHLDLGDVDLYYTGDICLHASRTGRRTDRDHFLHRLIGRIDGRKRDRNVVLLDATMAGADAGASGGNVPSALFEAASSAGAKDIVISAPSADHLLYAHLDIFKYVSENAEHRDRWWFVMPEEARPMFEVIHHRWSKLRSGRDSGGSQRLDPFLFTQYGGTLATWSESTWLLWGRPTWKQPSERGRIWYVTPRSLQGTTPDPAMIWVHVPRGRQEDKFTAWAPHRATAVDTSAWTMHTSAENLADATRRLSDRATVILFHQSPTKIGQFIEHYGLNARALTKDPLSI